MRLCANWLPLSPALTRDVARTAERVGLWGLGIGDSPKYGELYAACSDALSATSTLTVTTSVTNPVTRHWSVHASAARTFATHHPGRFRLGVGRGDSAVHTFGLRPASLAELEEFARSVTEAVDTEGASCPVLVAASGRAAARAAGRVAQGVIAGVGTDPVALATIRAEATSTTPEGNPAPEIWATVRLAVATDDAEAVALRRRLVPRAVGAAHFAFASTFAGKNVPEELAPVLAERFAAYAYRAHGRSGATANAELFADRPDIEDYLLDRFAITGLPDECRARLDALSTHVDGSYVSLLFEDAVEQLERIGDLY